MKKEKRSYTPRMPAIACPHCQSRCIVRNSYDVTAMVRELRMTCENVDCGHVFVGQLSVVRTLRPSAQPNPAVHLPFGTWRAQPAKPANDDAPPLPANDDEDGLAAAIGAVFAQPVTT
ncbi:ogr/Delta-like zinc finger family protein [Sphingomonas melonis]|uniref:ogr/Delta-like zinc finger family protein n=1 Tax=Sphingomonas melonis TaxID=152682 RepID=UPI00209BD809|nr:ogr/Delta-like zinc finger family protein [Sphingomonas melonis]